MFNKELSYQLDAVIILLEAPHIPFLIRLALRYLKRRLERDIPAWQTRNR